MDTTQNSIVYAVNSDLDDGILYAEFETKDAAIEYAKRNLDKLPFVDELQVSRDANGEVDEVFEYKTIWDHTMADSAEDETEDDYWDDLENMYDDSEKHVIGDTTWFEEGWLDKDGVWDESDDALIANYEKAMSAKDVHEDYEEWGEDADAVREYEKFRTDLEKHPIRNALYKAVHETVDTDELVETLEENEDTVECKECFDLFPKADCIKVDFGYICPTCAEGGTVSEEDIFKLDFPEYEKMSIGNDMIPEDPIIPAESSEEVPPVEVEDEIDPIPTPEDAIPFLVKDEEEAIAGYEKAAEVVADSDLENKDEILDTIDHIKEEEEEHIEELTKLTEPADEDEEGSAEEVEEDEIIEDPEALTEAYDDLDSLDSEIVGASSDMTPDEMKQRLQVARLAHKLQKANLKTARTSTKVHRELAKHNPELDQAQQELATNKVNYKNQKTITKTQREIAKQNPAADEARKELDTANINLQTQKATRKLDPEKQELKKKLGHVRLATKLAKRQAKLDELEADTGIDADESMEEAISKTPMTEKVDPLRNLRKITKDQLKTKLEKSDGVPIFYDAFLNEPDEAAFEGGEYSAIYNDSTDTYLVCWIQYTDIDFMSDEDPEIIADFDNYDDLWDYIVDQVSKDEYYGAFAFVDNTSGKQINESLFDFIRNKLPKMTSAQLKKLIEREDYTTLFYEDPLEFGIDAREFVVTFTGKTYEVATIDSYTDQYADAELEKSFSTFEDLWNYILEMIAKPEYYPEYNFINNPEPTSPGSGSDHTDQNNLDEAKVRGGAFDFLKSHIGEQRSFGGVKIGEKVDKITFKQMLHAETPWNVPVWTETSFLGLGEKKYAAWFRTADTTPYGRYCLINADQGIIHDSDGLVNVIVGRDGSLRQCYDIFWNDVVQIIKTKIPKKNVYFAFDFIDPQLPPLKESLFEAFPEGEPKLTKEDLYDRLVNKGESIDLDIGDQGYSPEDTGSFSDGGYYSNSIINIEFNNGKFGATEFYMSESGAEKEGYWDFETASFDKLWDILTSTFEPEDLVEHINKEYPAVESTQELEGTDNAVVDCKVADVVSHSEDENCAECETKKDPLNENLVLLGTFAAALAVSLADAAVGGFFWDNLKRLAATIFKRKPKSRWFAYKNYIIEQTEEGQINIWNLKGEQVGTDLKTIRLAKQLVKNLSKTEDQEIPAEESKEVASAVAEAELSDPMVEIDPDALEAIEEAPVDETSLAPEEDNSIELIDIQ